MLGWQIVIIGGVAGAMSLWVAMQYLRTEVPKGAKPGLRIEVFEPIEARPELRSQLIGRVYLALAGAALLFALFGLTRLGSDPPMPFLQAPRPSVTGPDATTAPPAPGTAGPTPNIAIPVLLRPPPVEAAPGVATPAASPP